MKVFFFKGKINVLLNVQNLHVIFKDISVKLEGLNAEPIQHDTNSWKLFIRNIEKTIQAYLKM